MSFDPIRAEIRFGCGLSPRQAPVASADEMLARLKGPDAIAQAYPVPTFAAFHARMGKADDLRRTVRKAPKAETRKAAKEALQNIKRDVRKGEVQWFGQTLLRRAMTADGLRERLVWFWADHFTVEGKGNVLRRGRLPHIETTIRPNVAGTFADMLRAVAGAPVMLRYLNQANSIGPNSPAAQTSRRDDGLNENLAREMLELHTLGVDGPYTQDDVRQLAELLTGLSYGVQQGFHFRPDRAEPGAETILGVSYGGKEARLEDIYAALDDLAAHPATARHLAWKLAVHFTGDTPDAGLIDALAARYLDSGGDLMAVYEVLLTHPGAWGGSGNVKQPIDFIGSSLRALDLTDKHVPISNERKMRDEFLTPLALMGQQMGKPVGPDGWPEEDDSWITPQRLAARLQWAMTVPFLLRRVLPDPREFVETALGTDVPGEVRFAARAAESRAEGVGIVLASPAFQRM